MWTLLFRRLSRLCKCCVRVRRQAQSAVTSIGLVTSAQVRRVIWRVIGLPMPTLAVSMPTFDVAVSQASNLFSKTLGALRRSDLVAQIIRTWTAMPDKQQHGALFLLCGTCSGLLFLGRRRRLVQVEDPAIVPAFHKLLAKTGGVSGNAKSGESSLVRQIVLTGGPIGGKATLASRLRSALSQRGWDVVIAPSVVAIIGNAGVALPSSTDGAHLLEFEAAVLELQHALEASLKRAAAAAGDRTVVIYDRGILDPAAFVPREQWGALAAMTRLVPRPLSWYAPHLVAALTSVVCLC